MAVETPCTSSSVLARIAALTGASASPKPKPQITSGSVATGLSQATRGSQLAIRGSRPRHIAMPTAVTTPPAAGADQVAADDGADRQRDQEPHQHQRGHQLRARVDRGAGEDRDVDQRRDQRRADEEADQHRAPGRRTPERAARHQRRLGPAQVQHEGDGGDRRAEEVPEPLVGEDLHRRVGGREGEDHAAQRDGQEQRPDAGRPRGRCGPSRAGRRAGRVAVPQRTTNSTKATIGIMPMGVSQRPSPANGMKYSPQVRSRTSRLAG